MTPTAAAMLLADALGPDARTPDPRFAARVRLAIAEEERFRNWRKAALRRVGSDALILLGLAGPALGAARILSVTGPLATPTTAALIGALVIGGWLAMNGEFHRPFAY